MKLKLSELKLQSFVTSLEEAHKRTVVGGDDCPPGFASWEGTGTGANSGASGAYYCNGCPGSSYCNPASGGYGCSGAATGYACNVQHC